MGGTLIGVGVTVSNGDRMGVDAVATPERNCEDVEGLVVV